MKLIRVLISCDGCEELKMLTFTDIARYEPNMDMLEKVVLEAQWKKFGQYYFCPKCQFLHQVYTECSTSGKEVK